MPQSIVIPEERVRHIFRDAPGHLTDTPTNRKRLVEVANDPETRFGKDQFGNIWHARTEPSYGFRFAEAALSMAD